MHPSKFHDHCLCGLFSGEILAIHHHQLKFNFIEVGMVNINEYQNQRNLAFNELKQLLTLYM